MKQKTLTLVFCVFASGLLAQMPAAGPSFFGRVSFSNFVAGGSGDYVGDLTNFVDQTGHGWLLSDLPLPAAITVPNGAIFEIVAINIPGVLTANVDVRFVQGQNIAPTGNGYIGALVGPLGLIPFSTTNSAGLTAKMQAEIENYNKNRQALASGSPIDFTFVRNDSVFISQGGNEFYSGKDIVDVDSCGSAYQNSDKVFAAAHGLDLSIAPWDGYGFMPVVKDAGGNFIPATTQNGDSLKMYYLIEVPHADTLVLSHGGRLCRPNTLTPNTDYFLQNTPGTIGTTPDTSFNDIIANALSSESVFLHEMRPSLGVSVGVSGGSGSGDVHVNSVYRVRTTFVDTLFVTLNDGTVFMVEDSNFLVDPIIDIDINRGQFCDTVTYMTGAAKNGGYITCNYPPELECRDTVNIITPVEDLDLGEPVIFVSATSATRAVYGQKPDGFVLERLGTSTGEDHVIMTCGNVDIGTLTAVDQAAWTSEAAGRHYFSSSGFTHESAVGADTLYPLFRLAYTGGGINPLIIAHNPFKDGGGGGQSLFQVDQTLTADRGHDLGQFDFLFNDVNSYQQGYFNNALGYGFIAENQVSAADRFRFGIGNDGLNNFFRMYTINAGERTGLDWNGTTLFFGRNLLGASGVHFELSGSNWKIEKLPVFADDAAAGVGGLTAGDVYQTDGTAAAPLNVAGILMRKQ